MRRLGAVLGISSEHLREVAKRAGAYYKSWDITKGNGGLRHIDVPKSELRHIQKRINSRILRSVPFPAGMFGGVKGKRLHENALVHRNQPDVVALDLRDCFPRTDNMRVYQALVRELKCSSRVAALLTRLTTFQHRLPQGTATSTALANLVLLALYRDLEVVARRHGLQMTFWIDDIVFSGSGAREALPEVFPIIQRHGYSVRHRKIKLMSKSESQMVTGLIVNRRHLVPRENIKEIRDSILRLAHKRQVTELEIKSIRGRIEFVRSTSPTQAAALQRLADRKLPHPTSPGERTPPKKIACRGTRFHRHRPKLPLAKLAAKTECCQNDHLAPGAHSSIPH